MEQDTSRQPERRRHRRQPAAFSFWFRTRRSAQRVSGWMLDLSAGGASFLVPTGQVPSVGDQLELHEMPTRDRLVREDANPLPLHARVLRYDSDAGPTRRVAVRFEVESGVENAHDHPRHTAVACDRPVSSPLVPPLGAQRPSVRIEP